MNLVIVHADNLDPRVEALGKRFNARVENLAGDSENYYRFLSREWSKGQSFVLLEGDILPDEDLLVELAVCPEPWCVFVYLYSSPDLQGRNWLTATWGMPGKYSADLMRRYPNALRDLTSPEAAQWSGERLPATHWYRVGAALSDFSLMKYGLQPHIHLRPIRHLRLEGIDTRVVPREPSDPVKVGDRRGWIELGEWRDGPDAPAPVSVEQNSDLDRVIATLQRVADQ